MVAAAQPFPLLKVNFTLFPVKMILKKWTSVVEDISASARDAYWVNTPGHELFQGNSNHNKTFEIVVRCSILDLSIINSNKYIVINLTKEKKKLSRKSKASQKSGQDIHRDLHKEQPQRESLCEREAGPPSK